MDRVDIQLLPVDLFLYAGEVGQSGLVIELELAADVLAGFMDEVAVVGVLDQAFERQSDQQADRDGKEMNEEVFLSVNGLVRGVDFHGGSGVR
jgi:hypothetical protein